MCNKVSKTKKAGNVRIRSSLDAERELNKVRKYNQYLNLQVDRLWSELMNLHDELAETRSTVQERL